MTSKNYEEYFPRTIHSWMVTLFGAVLLLLSTSFFSSAFAVLQDVVAPEANVVDTSKLRGRILNEEGLPIEGAQITPMRMNAPLGSREFNLLRTMKATTDANGTWEWDLSKSPGIESFRTSAPGYLPAEILIRDGKVDSDLQLKRALRITGTVKGKDGKSRSNVQLYPVFDRRVPDLIRPTASSMVPDGEFKDLAFKDFPDRILALTSSGESAVSDSLRSIDIRNFHLVLQPPARCVIGVTDAAGRPIANANVEARIWEGAVLTLGKSQTGNDGQAAFDSLPRGQTWFTVKANGYRNAWVNVNVGEESQTVKLYPVQRLEIQAIDDDTSEAIPDFQVNCSYTRKIGSTLAETEFYPALDGSASVRMRRNLFIVLGKNGAASIENDLHFEQMTISIISTGYLSIVNETVEPSELAPVRKYRLRRPSNDRFVVLTPDGRVADNAVVIYSKICIGIPFVEPEIVDGPLPNAESFMTKRQYSDKTGQVVKDWNTEHKVCLIWHEEGWHIAPIQKVKDANTITLERWGQVVLEKIPPEESEKSGLFLTMPMDVSCGGGYLLIPMRLVSTDDSIELTRVPLGKMFLAREEATPNMVLYRPMVNLEVKSDKPTVIEFPKK